MISRDPFSTEEPEGTTLSHWSLAVADALAEAEGDGRSLAWLQANVTQYAEGKIAALNKHGFVISESHAIWPETGRVFVLTHDPRERRLAA